MATNKLTEQSFFEQCDETHGAFFGDLMARWRAAGQEVRPEALSFALRLGKTTVCSLYPAYRNKGAAARLNLESLRKAFGKKWADSLAADLRAIEEIKTGAGSKELVVVRPAELEPGCARGVQAGTAAPRVAASVRFC